VTCFIKPLVHSLVFDIFQLHRPINHDEHLFNISIYLIFGYVYNHYTYYKYMYNMCNNNPNSLRGYDR
jgi:hypothetical protein